MKYLLFSALLALVAAACATAPRPQPSAASPATLSGTVTYLPRIALPPDAVVEVQLKDVSLADAPAKVLAEQTITTAGRQVPIPFTLRYDAADIQQQHTYAVRAAIRDADGTLRWTSDTMHPVLTRDAPSDGVEIRVVQVPQGGTTSTLNPSPENRRAIDALTRQPWQLFHIALPGGSVVTPEAGEQFTLSFDQQGRYGGKAACNSIGGEYEVKDGNHLLLSRSVTTLMACPQPSAADAFLDALQGVDVMEVQNNTLVLTTMDARRLVFRPSPTVAQSDAENAPMRPQPAGSTQAFDCPSAEGPFSFVTRNGPGEMALWLPERFGSRYLVLGQVRAASGAKFEEGDTVFWSKGDEATLELDGETYTCRVNTSAGPWEHARATGVTFRALGNEPGWLLDIREGERIDFTYDYGEGSVAVPAPAPQKHGDTTVYEASTEAHTLNVVLKPQACTDTMSGEAYDYTVAVSLDGRAFEGCGRML